MNFVWYCFFSGEFFKFGRLKRYIFSRGGGRGGVFFLIRRGNKKLMLVVYVVYFVFVCNCEIDGVGGGVVIVVGVKHRDVIEIKTRNSFIFRF